MRENSVAEIKGTTTCPRQKRPRANSNTGKLYDLLMANKGKPVSLAHVKHISDLALLNNVYGLDIRHAREKYHYVLAGEWFGRVYIDYIINPKL